MGWGKGEGTTNNENVQTRCAMRGGRKGKVMSEGVREHDCDISQGNAKKMGGGEAKQCKGGGKEKEEH